MSDDLTDSNYRPEYTGEDGLGDVGCGREFGADLYALYRAGRNELPQLANLYAQLVWTIHPVRGEMESSFDRPGLGMERAHRRLLELRDEVHAVLRQNCLRMQEVGRALVETADNYAATDEAAAAEFSRLLDVNSDEYGPSPPTGLDPPAPDADIPSRPPNL